MNHLDEIASCFSTLFLEDYDLPCIDEVSNLIKKYCEADKESLEGAYTLCAIVSKFLMDSANVFMLATCSAPFSSETFSKQFSYRKNAVELEKPLLVGIKLLLTQTASYSPGDITYVTDYLRGVILFNKVNEERCNDAICYMQSIFDLCLGKDGIMNPFKGQSVPDVFSKSCRSEKFVSMLNKYCMQRATHSCNDETNSLMENIVMTAAKLSNVNFKSPKQSRRGLDEVDNVCDCEGDCPHDVVPFRRDGMTSNFTYFGEPPCYCGDYGSNVECDCRW